MISAMLPDDASNFFCDIDSKHYYRADLSSGKCQRKEDIVGARDREKVKGSGINTI